VDHEVEARLIRIGGVAMTDRQPKPAMFIKGEPWWKFTFTYRFEGKEYAFDIPARSAEEAKARLGQISLARFEGQVDGDEIPFSSGGFLVPLICWWRNLRSRNA
jgi:hypothetical protein